MDAPRPWPVLGQRHRTELDTDAVNRSLALLGEALAIIDQTALPGDIGARLQHVIDRIDEEKALQ